jgi:hypothetical protein
MAAPLPMRFYNPVKELCTKANLDYETVIGTAISPEMRQTFLNADIPKLATDFNTKDRLAIKHKIDFLNRKYGSSNTTDASGGEIKDKGIERYAAGLIVEPICSDDCKTDESGTSSDGVESNVIIKGNSTRNNVKWIPGKGLSKPGV